MKSNLYLIGGVNSFGVPYTRDNKNNISHLRVVFDYLQSLDIEVNMLDVYSMNKYNDTEYINSLLECGINLHEIKENQIESIDLCRKSGIFQFVKLPSSTKRLYVLDEADKKRLFVDIIRDNKVVFVYSCGINDFLKKKNTDLAKFLNPKNMEEAFVALDETINLIIKKIEGNVEKLIALNPDIEIYILGTYIPTRVRYIRKIVDRPICLYNEALQILCKKYNNVYYVDNSNLLRGNMGHADWHPNYTGQKLMGENIISAIKSNSKILIKK